jgi:predicted nuclease with TOPRIM domain
VVVGDQVLEKAEAQARQLVASQQELEQARRSEQDMKERIAERKAERQDIEKRTTSLQDESQALSRQIRRVWTQNQQVNHMCDVILL